MTIRVGVIGAGSWAVASHLPNLRRDPEVEFVAVARKGPELLAKIKDEFGFGIASEDYRAVIDAGVDVCIVASPSGLHHEHAKAALESGAHVMCEKPVTIDPAQAWDLVDIATRVNRQLVIAFGWNYRPMIEQAKRIMTEEGIGTLEHLTVTMASVTRELLSNTGAYPDASPESVPEQRTWTDPTVSGGGYGQAQLSHALGLAFWLTGARVAQGFALMSAPLNAPVELHDAIVYTLDGGGIGVLSGASCHLGAGGNKHALEVRAIGSEGQLLVDVEREALWHFRHGKETRVDLTPGEGTYDCEGPIAAVLAAARGQDVNQSPGELGARTVEALAVAYRSARSGQLERR
ncbi:MAG: Gfo/Idh/MocA family oxidoreductase [Actinomycetales bacterium]|nr:Gfo/Idh/MocA family oxidoreductase [Actinomycetales bacterium]